MQVFDVTKGLKVLEALSDEYSRKIVLSIISKSLSIEEISKEQSIPISTCYRRIHELQNYGLVKVDRTVIDKDGKKFVCYLASFKNASISLDSGELSVDIVPNVDGSDRLNEMWSSIRENVRTVDTLPDTNGPIPLLHTRVRTER